MNVFVKSFWQTLWQDKKLLIIVVGVALGLALVYGMYKYASFQFNRTWNWNVGGYKTKTMQSIKANNCELGKGGAFRDGYEWKQYCD